MPCAKSRLTRKGREKIQKIDGVWAETLKGFRSGAGLLAMLNLSHPPLPDSIQIIWAKARTWDTGTNKELQSTEWKDTKQTSTYQNVLRLPAEETAQSGKCLLQKPQGLSAISHIHVKNAGVTLCECHPRAGAAEVQGSLGPTASHPSPSPSPLT